MNAKLGGRKERVFVCIEQQLFGHDFFQELTKALDEGDGSIGLGLEVVIFPRLGNDDYHCFAPEGQVVTKVETSIKKVSNDIVGLRPCKFDDLPRDA